MNAVQLWDLGAFASVALVLVSFGFAIVTGGLLGSG
jgi:hypothetical protein